MQDLRNQQQTQRRQDKIRKPRKIRSIFTDFIDPTTARFCTFNLGTKRGVGVVEDEDIRGKKTIRVTVINLAKKKTVAGGIHIQVTGKGVKRHVIKDAIKFSPIGVIPHP